MKSRYSGTVAMIVYHAGFPTWWPLWHQSDCSTRANLPCNTSTWFIPGTYCEEFDV